MSQVYEDNLGVASTTGPAIERTVELAWFPSRNVLGRSHSLETVLSGRERPINYYQQWIEPVVPISIHYQLVLTTVITHHDQPSLTPVSHRAFLTNHTALRHPREITKATQLDKLSLWFRSLGIPIEMREDPSRANTRLFMICSARIAITSGKKITIKSEQMLLVHTSLATCQWLCGTMWLYDVKCAYHLWPLALRPSTTPLMFWTTLPRGESGPQQPELTSYDA